MLFQVAFDLIAYHLLSHFHPYHFNKNPFLVHNDIFIFFPFFFVSMLIKNYKWISLSPKQKWISLNKDLNLERLILYIIGVKTKH